MSERINTVLIVGGTSGIGEAFARRFHDLGKKVIITGRNQEKLMALAQELPGLEAREVSCTRSSLSDCLPSSLNGVCACLAREIGGD